MALEAMISHYLSSNCNYTNDLPSSSFISPLGIENNQTSNSNSFLSANDPNLPPLPRASSINGAPYPSSSFVCQPFFAFGSPSVQTLESQEQMLSPLAGVNLKKRRRPRIVKNTQEIENQRMMHITVERNRRKQMNEHLAMLRSLMPPSYVRRGDQASIIGGAIDFVKELEHLVHSLEARKRERDAGRAKEPGRPFSSFFTCPQYSAFNTATCLNELWPVNPPAIADIEVTMTETYANLKVLSVRRPKQLFKMVAGLQTLHLTVLHLNVTTMNPFVLYSFSTKVEEQCVLTTVEEIATAAYKMLSNNHKEAAATAAAADPKVRENCW